VAAGEEKMKISHHYLLIIIGIVLIIAVSLMNGFGNSFIVAVYHIINDLTVELPVHAYIAGIVLIITGIIKLFMKKKYSK